MENPCEGKSLLEEAHQTNYFLQCLQIFKLEGHIVLDYFLLKYMIGNHHSLQFIKISFETYYIDQHERITEDAPV